MKIANVFLCLNFLLDLFLKKPLFCLSLYFLNFSRDWAWDFLKIFFVFIEIYWLKWVKFSFLYLVCSSLYGLNNNDATFNFGQQKHLILETEPCNFLTIFSILAIWFSFSYKVFFVKDVNMTLHNCVPFPSRKIFLSIIHSKSHRNSGYWNQPKSRTPTNRRKDQPNWHKHHQYGNLAPVLSEFFYN